MMQTAQKKRYIPKIDCLKLSTWEVYECLVDGEIRKFPNGFVTKENMKEIIRKVVLENLAMTREDICSKMSWEYLREYRLAGSRKVFGNNVYQMISYCFPEMEIKYWELKKVENGFWGKKENRRQYMQWLAEKEHIDVYSIESLSRIDAHMIQRNGGCKAIRYGEGVYSLIMLIAKVDVKEWQVIKMRVWTKEKAIAAVRWMIEEKLKWSHEDVVQNINAKIFYEYDLGGLLCKVCDHSPIRALELAYPGQYTKVRNSRPQNLIRK